MGNAEFVSTPSKNAGTQTCLDAVRWAVGRIQDMAYTLVELDDDRQIMLTQDAIDQLTILADNTLLAVMDRLAKKNEEGKEND